MFLYIHILSDKQYSQIFEGQCHISWLISRDSLKLVSLPHTQLSSPHR